MSGILETLHNYTAENPNVPILFDDAHSKGITYSQFDEMTGRVYAWLREQGIGKEDFVLINLPRGVFPIVAMVGVWKAGAAWAQPGRSSRTLMRLSVLLIFARTAGVWRNLTRATGIL